MNYKKVREPIDVPIEKNETLDTGIPVTGTVTGCNHLNIRKEPNGDIIGIIPKDSTVIIEDETTYDEWYKVVIESGIVGSCMKQFITKE